VQDHAFIAIDHVQLAMPGGEEEAARRFYRDVLGMDEIVKPKALAARGGCWFASGPVLLHLGVETEFRPARKAHPALRCRDYVQLLQRIEGAGIEIVADEALPGVRRCYVHDPFGNRIELVAAPE
jgi:catechol 2,3-dioxygenase-like lactoylglutathione lyase family enzyme